MATRPVVSIYSYDKAEVSTSEVPLPEVFKAPIRTDIIRFVHTNMAKNSRQPYAVFKRAGHQHSAESWGTGRAVACVPRVSGGGTSRSGQGAFANMCRKGRMFAPTKVWRKWHRKVNQNEKRYAVASAIAASSHSALVESRGHRIEQVCEIPFVVNNISNIVKTKNAVEFLKLYGFDQDVQKVIDSKAISCGRAKMRNRRYSLKIGPMLIHDDNENTYAFRNIPGISICNVNCINLLKMAPGGHCGRLVIWTEQAFKKLNTIYNRNISACIETGDIKKIINSVEVQSIVKEKMKNVPHQPKRNPLKNKEVYKNLNPYKGLINKSNKAKNTKKYDNNKKNYYKFMME